MECRMDKLLKLDFRFDFELNIKVIFNNKINFNFLIKTENQFSC